MAATLISTTDRFDAGLLGYERACNPREDGEGLIITLDDGFPLSITLLGPEGEITLSGKAEVREVANTLLSALRAAEKVAA
ncbi:hypothetical protein [Phenylobacterium sp.]|uniref:hypothetical protein n=1 Tax=Phenylobacterium sp. TaxID=1871053 RepID=UPI002730DAC3|nr:hypothetical protein [Phenylobacterium sp.]MDP1873684.1 hypothetical protein [Phenylobacterium sp.]